MSKYGPAITALEEAIDHTSRCYDHCKGKAQDFLGQWKDSMREEGGDEELRLQADGMERAATACFEALPVLRTTLDGMGAGTHEGLGASAEACSTVAAALDPSELDPSCFTTAEACRAAEKKLREAA